MKDPNAEQLNWRHIAAIIAAGIVLVIGLITLGKGLAFGAPTRVQPPPPAVQPPPPTPARTTVPCSQQMLRVGSSGPCVRILQGRLHTFKVPRGPLDGQFGVLTEEGVIIMQRAFGLKSDGIVGPHTWRVIMRGKQPFWPHKPGMQRYTVVNQTRQLLYEIQHGSLYRIIRTSSGKNAKTRDGSFEIYNKVPGWGKSPLCNDPNVPCIYDGNYVDGGIAIHGSRVVPPYPASHGCIRIQLWEASGYFARNPIGTPVFIVGTPGPTPPGV